MGAQLYDEVWSESERADDGEAAWDRQALRQCVARARLPIYVCDRSYVIRIANQAYADIEGLQVDEVIGQPLAEVIGTGLFEIRKEWLDQALCGQDCEIRTWVRPRHEPSGRQYDVQYLSLKNDAGDVAGVVVLATPVGAAEVEPGAGALRSYRQVFRQAEDGLLRLEALRAPDGQVVSFRILEANPSIARVAGRQQDELEGELLSDALAELEPSDLQDRLEDAIRAGAPQQFDIHHRLGGREGWLRAGVYSGDGNELTVLFSDISEAVDHKRQLQTMVERLSSETRRFQRLYQKTPALLLSLSEAGIIEDASDLLFERMGVARGSLIGRPFSQFLAPDALERLSEDSWPRLFRDGAIDAEPCCLILPDSGERFEVELSAFLAEEGLRSGVRQVMIVLADVTQRNRALYNSKRSERDYRILVDRLPDLISRARPDATLFFVNRHYIDFFGPDEAGLLGRKFTELVPETGQQALQGQLAAMTREAPASILEQVNYDRYGAARNILWFSLLIHDVHGQPQEILSIGRDVTALREANNRLLDHAARLESANESLQQFAFVASHDLQEPLRKIRLYADVLRSVVAPEDGGEADEALQVITRAARNGSRLISDLLTYTRSVSRDLEVRGIQVGDVVGRVLEELGEEIGHARVAVTCELLPDPVLADPVSLREVLYNLVSNAIKYRAPDRAPTMTIRFAAAAAGDPRGFTLSVADNGIGFEQGYAELIFQPFKRLHSRGAVEGTGIGLAICEMVARRNGWTIRASGRPGEGARFDLILPKG